MTEVTDAHNARVRAVGPLLRDAPAPDAADPGYIRVEASGGVAEGVLRFTEVAPDSPDAVWGALRRHTADVRVAGTEAGIRASLGGLLDAWLDRVRRVERAGDGDSSMRLVLPTRDIALAAPLLAKGFAPVGIHAVRQLPRASAASAPAVPSELDGAVVRRATADDADELGRMDAELLELDAHFGGVTLRPGAARTFAGEYRERLRRAPDTTWVLEREGRLTGLVHVMPDDGDAEPDSPVLAAGGGQCLVVMYLDPAERGAGTGARLVSLAHDALDAAGTPYTVLSYAVPNPRSGPFWARMGYRPLVTEWQRRPALFD